MYFDFFKNMSNIPKCLKNIMSVKPCITISDGQNTV